MTGKSWHEGCPVSLDDLAAVTVAFVGFDGAEHSGTIVVHRQLAAEVADIFEQLHAARFPIATVAPWEDYGPRVYAEKNVTTGFYCETAQDDPGRVEFARLWLGHRPQSAAEPVPRSQGGVVAARRRRQRRARWCARQGVADLGGLRDLRRARLGLGRIRGGRRPTTCTSSRSPTAPKTAIPIGPMPRLVCSIGRTT